MRTIPDKETLTTEFKSDKKRLHDNDLIDAVIGMANTKGGVLYLGVEDNGDITGVHKKHRDQNGAMALIANRTVPSLSVRAEIIEEEGVEEDGGAILEEAGVNLEAGGAIGGTLRVSAGVELVG